MKQRFACSMVMLETFWHLHPGFASNSSRIRRWLRQSPADAVLVAPGVAIPDKSLSPQLANCGRRCWNGHKSAVHSLNGKEATHAGERASGTSNSVKASRPAPARVRDKSSTMASALRVSLSAWVCNVSISASCLGLQLSHACGGQGVFAQNGELTLG